MKTVEIVYIIQFLHLLFVKYLIEIQVANVLNQMIHGLLQIKGNIDIEIE